MWLWCVLAALLIGIAWALKFVFNWGTSIPGAATGAILLLLAVVFLIRWLLARRAASSLERAIALQGSNQAMSARPERRAEIQELQRQLQAGISALKSSKLGRSGKRGASALYSMPWYMIIGPPGAGKTTALKHSGMVFPYGGSGGGGVRGVGGTRNCDWWFTNEAILLDTAGRYTTESDDRDEWLSFLAFLRRYRSKRPINGVIVAISITELVDASESQIEATGKKLRARMDEVMTQLHMVVPVYLLFTKIDLVSGFVEFFGDLKKSDRGRAWGATLKLDLPKAQPGKIFDAEFDLLVKHMHARGLRRLVLERSREAREKIVRFPLEFAGLKKQISDLIATAFQPNEFQGTPILRGFYFTSGTQEGRPMDRVLARMNAAMGIRNTEQAQQAPAVESKSYFLHDVFMTVIFPDHDIAAQSESEVRRRLIMKIVVAGAALALAATLIFPAVGSYFSNRSFLRETQRRAKLAAEVDWSDSKPPNDKLPQLRPLLEQLQTLDTYNKDGVPIGMRWWMYSADKLEKPSRELYGAQMRTGFALPCKAKLEESLKGVNGKKYLAERTLLRMYLMLYDVEHLDVEWATGRFTTLWVDTLASVNTQSTLELKDAVRPHVRYYFEQLKDKKIEPVAIDHELVKHVRTVLSAGPPDERYYAMFVDSLLDERIDESGDPIADNLVFPPIQIARVFPDRRDVLTYFLSKKYEAEKSYYQVDGPYTAKGRVAVIKQLKSADGLLRAEGWVVPLTAEETAKIEPTLKAVKQRYDERYINAWLGFFADLKMKVPTSFKDAADLYRILSKPEYPLRRILQVLEDNTQPADESILESNDAVQREVNKRFNQKLNNYLSSTQLTVGVDFVKLMEDDNNMKTKFKETTDFALATKGAASGNSKTFLYAQIVDQLLQQMFKKQQGNPETNLLDMKEEIAQARKDAEALLQGLGDPAKTILTPILLDPLQVGTTAPVTGVDPNKLPTNVPKGPIPPPHTWKPPSPSVLKPNGNRPPGHP
ncbi:MAG: type VI secretion system membrane subunit TssM [Polyangiaceae bacterium]